MLPEKRNKILKIVGGVLLGLLVLILIAFSGIQWYVNKNKASFVKLINEKLNDAIAGQASVGDVDVNVWRHFPNIDIRVQDIDIRDSVYNKSLLKMQYISTRLNVLKLITGGVDIHNIYLENGVIHLFTDKNGFSNNYIFKKDNPKKGKKKQTEIDEIELKNIHFVTENAVKNKWYGVKINDLHANLDFSDSITTIDMEENAFVRGLGFNLDKGYFLKGKTVKANWEITFNTKSKHLSFGETPVAIGPSKFLLQGDFYLADTTNSHFKLIAKSDAVNYREAASLVSPNIQSKINLVNLTKPLAINAVIEGPMGFRTIPVVNVQWVVKDNQLVTPVLTLDTCSFAGSYTNERNKAYPRTDDNSEIQLTKLSASWGGVLLVANSNTIVTNLVHPVLQFDLSSATTLTALDDKLDLSTLHFISGAALLNIQYNGPLGVDPSKLQYLSGNLVIKDAKVNYEPRALTFSNCNGEIIFSQTSLLVRDLQCDLNTNHFKIEVAGDNVNLLAASNMPGKADLVCSVFTPDLNLNDFKSLFQSRKTVAAKKKKGGMAKPVVQLDDALQNGTLDMKLQANAVHMNKFTASNVQAEIGFVNNDINIAKVALHHADGSLTMQANIHQVNDNYHEATTSVNLNNINVQKFFYQFSDFGMKSLTSNNIRGNLDMNADLKMGIDNKGTLLSKTMKGNLHFSLKKGALKHFQPLKNIQNFVFKNRDFDNIEFAELKDSLEINKGEVYVHRMEIQSNVLTAYVEGIYSFGNNTNLSIQVPLSVFDKRDEDYEVKNKGAHKKVGASVFLRAKDNGNGGVKVGLDLFKRLRNDDFKEEYKNLTGTK